MQWKEIPKDVANAASRFTQEQLAARERRLQDPEFVKSIDTTRQLMREDLKQAGESAAMTVVHLLLTTPGLTVFGLVKGPWDTLKHNMGTKDPKQKHSYIASLLKGPLAGLWEGLSKAGGRGWETLRSGAAATGRKAVIGARTTIGN
jgi:hypothetical protein